MSNKKELISKLRGVFASWEEFLEGRSEKDITVPAQPGKYSVSEVITHLHAWLELSTARVEAALLNKDPNLPDWLDGADPFYANDHVNGFNARIQEMHRTDSWSTRYREWSEGFSNFLELAERIPDSIMFDDQRYSWLRGYALAAVLDGALEHHQEHLDSTRNRMS
jgi:hypothetical protein